MVERDRRSCRVLRRELKSESRSVRRPQRKHRPGGSASPIGDSPWQHDACDAEGAAYEAKPQSFRRVEDNTIVGEGYGRGRGLGCALGVGLLRIGGGSPVGVDVAVAVGVAVGVIVAVAVGVAAAVAVAVAVGVAVGVGLGATGTIAYA